MRVINGLFSAINDRIMYECRLRELVLFCFVMSIGSDCRLIVARAKQYIIRAYVTVAPGLAVHLRPVHDERIVGVEAVRREGGVICPASALHA